MIMLKSTHEKEVKKLNNRIEVLKSDYMDINMELNEVLKEIFDNTVTINKLKNYIHNLEKSLIAKEM